MSELVSAADLLRLEARIQEASLALDLAEENVTFWKGRLGDLKSIKAARPIVPVLQTLAEGLDWRTSQFGGEFAYAEDRGVKVEKAGPLIEAIKLAGGRLVLGHFEYTANPPKYINRRSA